MSINIRGGEADVEGGDERWSRRLRNLEQEAPEFGARGSRIWSKRLRKFGAGGSGILEREAPEFWSRRLHYLE